MQIANFNVWVFAENRPLFSFGDDKKADRRVRTNPAFGDANFTKKGPGASRDAPGKSNREVVA